MKPTLANVKLSNGLPYQARKRFGQNFLHDQNIVDKIVEQIEPKNNEHLVEIGPGQGALTKVCHEGVRADL